MEPGRQRAANWDCNTPGLWGKPGCPLCVHSNLLEPPLLLSLDSQPGKHQIQGLFFFLFKKKNRRADLIHIMIVVINMGQYEFIHIFKNISHSRQVPQIEWIQHFVFAGCKLHSKPLHWTWTEYLGENSGLKKFCQEVSWVLSGNMSDRTCVSLNLVYSSRRVRFSLWDLAVTGMQIFSNLLPSSSWKFLVFDTRTIKTYRLVFILTKAN